MQFSVLTFRSCQNLSIQSIFLFVWLFFASCEFENGERISTLKDLTMTFPLVASKSKYIFFFICGMIAILEISLNISAYSTLINWNIFYSFENALVDEDEIIENFCYKAFTAKWKPFCSILYCIMQYMRQAINFKQIFIFSFH